VLPVEPEDPELPTEPELATEPLLPELPPIEVDRVEALVAVVDEVAIDPVVAAEPVEVAPVVAAELVVVAPLEPVPMEVPVDEVPDRVDVVALERVPLVPVVDDAATPVVEVVEAVAFDVPDVPDLPVEPLVFAPDDDEEVVAADAFPVPLEDEALRLLLPVEPALLFPLLLVDSPVVPVLLVEAELDTVRPELPSDFEVPLVVPATAVPEDEPLLAEVDALVELVAPDADPEAAAPDPPLEVTPLEPVVEAEDDAEDMDVEVPRVLPTDALVEPADAVAATDPGQEEGSVSQLTACLGAAPPHPKTPRRGRSTSHPWNGPQRTLLIRATPRAVRIRHQKLAER
jgi:hypothetical protein